MNRNYNLLMAEESNASSSLNSPNISNPKSKVDDKEPINFLCFDLSLYPKSVQFILL